MSFVNYAVLSTLILVGTVIHTYIQQEYFYPFLVALTQEKVQLAVIYNFMVMVMIMIIKVVVFMFVGKLNPLETEQLIENGRSMVADTLLFLIFYSPTISGREISTIVLVQNIGMILVLKIFHSIASIRTGRMFEVGVPSTVMLGRVGSLLLCLVMTDLTSLVLVWSLVEATSTFYTWLLFEFINISISALSSLLKFSFNFVDARLTSNGWPSKAVYIFYVELAADVLQMTSYMLFMGIFFYQNPARLPIYAIADLVQVARQLASRLQSFKRYREITADMETKFPDATPEEIEAAESCIICRDSLTAGCKVLQCGHIFHTTCLRSWVLVQQICPTCRSELLPKSRSESASSNQSSTHSPIAEQGATPATSGEGQSVTSVTDEPKTKPQVKQEPIAKVPPAYEPNKISSPSAEPVKHPDETALRNSNLQGVSTKDIIRSIEHAQDMITFYTEQVEFWKREVKEIQVQLMPPRETEEFRRVFECLRREVSTPRPSEVTMSRDPSMELSRSESIMDEVRRERQRKYEEELRLRHSSSCKIQAEQ